MIYTQGKDRKEQIKKCKEQHPNEKRPKKVRNVELKLGMTYKGWKETEKKWICFSRKRVCGRTHDWKNGKYYQC